MKKLLLASFLLLFNAKAHAYFDPGSGSLVAQVIIAVIGGVVLFFKNVRMRLTYFLFKNKIKGKDNQLKNHEE